MNIKEKESFIKKTIPKLKTNNSFKKMLYFSLKKELISHKYPNYITIKQKHTRNTTDWIIYKLDNINKKELTYYCGDNVILKYDINDYKDLIDSNLYLESHLKTKGKYKVDYSNRDLFLNQYLKSILIMINNGLIIK